jgi:rubrerythrin
MGFSNLYSALSVDQLLDEAVRREEDLLFFYEQMLPHSEYDIHQLFERLAEESRDRAKRLEGLKEDLTMLRTLTGAMAD